jgi:hypothetical protein
MDGVMQCPEGNCRLLMLTHYGRPVSTSCGVTWLPGTPANRPAGGGTSALASMRRRCSSLSRPAKIPGPANTSRQQVQPEVLY